MTRKMTNVVLTIVMGLFTALLWMTSYKLATLTHGWITPMDYFYSWATIATGLGAVACSVGFVVMIVCTIDEL